MECTPRNRILAVLTVALTFSLIAGCGDSATDQDDDLVLPPLPEANEYLDAVEVDGTAGTYVDAAFPQGGTFGTEPTVLGATQYILGGSIVLQITPSDQATALFVTVQATDNGYYEIDLTGAGASVSSGETALPSLKSNPKADLPKLTAGLSAASVPGSTNYFLTVTPSPDAPVANFRLLVSETDGTNISAAAPHLAFANTTAQGSGLLQVSLNWTHPVDMDIHVETPEGQDIYWANRNGSTGGVLDLDSNAGCSIDGVNNENITWLNSAPTPGTYRVRLNLWSACAEEGPFPYVVNVAVGGEAEFFSGFLTTGQELAGGAFDGEIITEVTVPAP